MPKVILNDRLLDARPDRLDVRDRPYRPILKSLPPKFPEQNFINTYLPRYRKNKMVLDQGEDGACTGFGLAAVINYLRWLPTVRSPKKHPAKVSERMLYHLARFYDEWPGEDYDGSSCRGALKGWLRHGVCTQDRWPYRDRNGKVTFIQPKKGWDEEAAQCTIGAYYRIDKDSVVDMQAATYEVGAIYVSAGVHKGWLPKGNKWIRDTDTKIALIETPTPLGQTGGHAFAIVGYTPIGFIVQNSWGPQWGTDGFAILPYSEWVEHGTDAWVAVLGVPTMGKSPHYHSSAHLTRGIAEPAQFLGLFEKKERHYAYKNKAVEPWDQDEAYRHSIVMGNNGIVLNRSVQQEDALSSLKDIAYTKPAAWLNNDGRTRLAFYAHGGLNSEEESVARIRILAPYFKANGIYPIFFTWKTGFLESFLNIVGDKIQGIEPHRAFRDIFETIKDAAKEAKDRTLETICRETLVKSIWSQIKQNADAAATLKIPTLGRVAEYLVELKKAAKNLEIHLVGHSAGSILLGHFLDTIQGINKSLSKNEQLSIRTCTLFVPACTIGFALQHYKPAVQNGVLTQDALHFDILSDKRELADSVGPYGKSLLYLVSRALEDYHNTPLLGMAKAWDQKSLADWPTEHRNLQQETADWLNFWSTPPSLIEHKQSHVSDGQGKIPLAHGSFDNDADVMADTLKRILRLGPGQKLTCEIETLRGY